MTFSLTTPSLAAGLIGGDNLSRVTGLRGRRDYPSCRVSNRILTAFNETGDIRLDRWVPHGSVSSSAALYLSQLCWRFALYRAEPARVSSSSGMPLASTGVSTTCG